MTRIPLEQAFAACQQNKTAWLSCKAELSRTEMVFREYELTGRVTGAETPESLRDRVDLIKWEVNQTTGRYIQAHEAVQRISIRRQLHAFM